MACLRGVAALHTPTVGLETVLTAATRGCWAALTDGLASPRPSVSSAPRVWHAAGCLLCPSATTLISVVNFSVPCNLQL